MDGDSPTRWRAPHRHRCARSAPPTCTPQVPVQGKSWFGGRALAAADLAAIRLPGGDLDAAAIALEPVLSPPSGQRITAITTRLTRVRADLAHPRYQGSPQAHDLDEQIEDFTRDTITTGLRELPGSPA
ncbi:MAG TPA: hypothetical protein VIV12_03435 [Streptosporangiaceae bacterium]